MDAGACSPCYAVTNPAAWEVNEAREELYRYLTDVPQDQPALTLGELEGSCSPHAVASARDENKLSADRLSLHREKKLHESL